MSDITPERIKALARQGRLSDIMDLYPADDPNRPALRKIAVALVASYANGKETMMTATQNKQPPRLAEPIRLGWNGDKGVL